MCQNVWNTQKSQSYIFDQAFDILFNKDEKQNIPNVFYTTKPIFYETNLTIKRFSWKCCKIKWLYRKIVFKSIYDDLVA